MDFWRVAKRVAVFVVVMLGLVGCAQRIDLLRENPMANPTLSFTEPSGQASSQGEDNPFFGNASQTVHSTRFDFDESQLELVKEELLEQSRTAGFEVEQVSPNAQLPFGRWQARSDEGILLTIFLNRTTALVSLR